MNFEWDEKKRLKNVKKHGIDFVDAEQVFQGFIMTVEDDRFEYGEIRYSTLGHLREWVVKVIHTPRGDTTRIISIRRANARERESFYDRLGQTRGYDG